MATRISFNAAGSSRADSVTVEASPDDVFGAWVEAHGLPFSLDQAGDRGKVFINPVTVTYWREVSTEPKVFKPRVATA